MLIIVEMHCSECICAFVFWPELITMQAAPTTLHEWYHFVLGTPVNDNISSVAGKNIRTKYGFQPFFKLVAIKI